MAESRTAGQCLGLYLPLLFVVSEDPNAIIDGSGYSRYHSYTHNKP